MIDVVLIGGSAGAISVLVDVLPMLSDDLVTPIVIALHLPPEPSRLSSVLGEISRRPVREAEDKEPLAPWTIFLAPPNYHLLVERDLTLALSVDAPVHYSRPSIDVLFEAAANALGPGVVAVVLSGANDDGAHGLERIRRAGGIAIVQDPTTADFSTMPLAALASTGNTARVVHPEELPDLLLACAKGSS
jgi:two-component system chemotaxis response regulator CheB